MTPNLTLSLVAGALVAAGVYMLLERSLSRALVGLLLLTNGINVLFLVASGPAGRAPFVGRSPNEEMSDPLPQAMVLTAIVISFGATAFLLAMAHRSWQLARSDDVADDVEDRRIVQLADDDLMPFEHEHGQGGDSLDDGADGADRADGADGADEGDRALRPAGATAVPTLPPGEVVP